MVRSVLLRLCPLLLLLVVCKWLPFSSAKSIQTDDDLDNADVQIRAERAWEALNELENDDDDGARGEAIGDEATSDEQMNEEDDDIETNEEDGNGQEDVDHEDVVAGDGSEDADEEDDKVESTSSEEELPVDDDTDGEEEGGDEVAGIVVPDDDQSSEFEEEGGEDSEDNDDDASVEDGTDSDSNFGKAVFKMNVGKPGRKPPSPPAWFSRWWGRR